MFTVQAQLLLPLFWRYLEKQYSLKQKNTELWPKQLLLWQLRSSFLYILCGPLLIQKFKDLRELTFFIL